MTEMLDARLDRALAALPRNYAGPGGAVAVLREGAVLARHAWGWANAERRVPFTPKSLFRMCSITKQFTCASVLAALADPRELDAAIAARLPRLAGPKPNALQLAHNQSGLRDYWAVAMLHGSPAEAPFGDAEAAMVIGGARSLQFAPGTRSSYVNQNFRLLGDVLAERTGRSLAEHLRSIFERAGMASAILAADTRALPDGTEGYEEMNQGGHRVAVNRLIWTGDAGLGASLDDMIAWEKHIDATRDDASSLYQRLAAPVTFADGRVAPYGFGLAREEALGRPATGHGGGLRGWSSHRLYLPRERISVVVMLNHIGDARAAAIDVLAAVLGEARPKPDASLPPPAWLGAYVEPETGIVARIEAGEPGRVKLHFASWRPEILDLKADGSAGGGARASRLVPVPQGLRLERPADNLFSTLVPVRPAAAGAPTDFAGRYRCAELDAELSVVDAGVPYAAFSGCLGQGRMELLEPLGDDLWAMPCPRALDHSPPGDWTLAVRRDGAGRAVGVTLGCWLARGLDYQRC
ncbi:MAG: D-aminopeptidase [Rhodospirillales bacterium]|nr:D-aminopeptidase [Rhodospirillales bacterium]